MNLKTDGLNDWRMKEGPDGWTERERDKGRKRAPHHCNRPERSTAPLVYHDLERSSARRMTEERVEESEERTKEGQGDGWGRNRARDQCMRTTERWRSDTWEQ